MAPNPYDRFGPERNVDLLFVVDNSGSMAEKQALFREKIGALFEELRAAPGGMPNLHIGVTSTDLGTNPYPITYCETRGGDGGRLLTGQCPNPRWLPFIVDIEAAGCEIHKDLHGRCLEHHCRLSDCPSGLDATMIEDPLTGCPRCRSYAGEELEEVFDCLANLGIQGCGFEQPLEAMYRALDPSNVHNSGFLRERSTLVVIFLTDEDDCSASNPQLYDHTQTSMEAPLGPLTSFRCFEHGIHCDENAREHQGTRASCQPREDAGALLHPVSRYIDFLHAIKDPRHLHVMAIAGPVGDHSVTIGRDDYDQPKLMPSCKSAHGTADPAIRLHAVVEAVTPPEELGQAFASICSPSFEEALVSIGARIAGRMRAPCMQQPLGGCSDPGAAFGYPKDDYPGNDLCLPFCRVLDIFERGLPTGHQAVVPHCLEVCPEGPCPGNQDYALAYAGGYPRPLDPHLPVSACWQVGYQPLCPESHFGELVVSRREPPPPRSFTDAACIHILPFERLCDDGLDNDEDGLVDREDPDCQ